MVAARAVVGLLARKTQRQLVALAAPRKTVRQVALARHRQQMPVLGRMGPVAVALTIICTLLVLAALELSSAVRQVRAAAVVAAAMSAAVHRRLVQAVYTVAAAVVALLTLVQVLVRLAATALKASSSSNICRTPKLSSSRQQVLVATRSLLTGIRTVTRLSASVAAVVVQEAAQAITPVLVVVLARTRR